MASFGREPSALNVQYSPPPPDAGLSSAGRNTAEGPKGTFISVVRVRSWFILWIARGMISSGRELQAVEKLQSVFQLGIKRG